MQESTNISIKKAALLNAGSKYTVVLWNLVLSAVLARILTPEDYGVVAVTTVFTNFFSIFANMGLGTGVIQNKSLTKQETNGIYSFTFYMGILLGIVFVIFSVPMSWIYGNPVYKQLGVLLGISLFFSTLNMIPNALMMKNKQFLRVAIRNVVIPVITSILAVFMAVMGWKYYALVMQSLLTNIITYVWNAATVHKYYDLKLSFRIRGSGLNKIKSFSGYQFAFSFVNYFSRNLDNLLIGRFISESALGFYDKAYKLMLYPVNYLTNVITPVLHPILSEYQNDKEYIYRQYMKIVQLLSMIGVFILPMCFFSAEEIILILYGEKWKSAIPCFKALSLSVWAQMITSSTGAIFQSTGNTKAMLKGGTINTVITVVAIMLGMNTGKIGVTSIYVTIAYNIHMIVGFYILFKEALHIKYWRFVCEMYLDIVMLIVLMISILMFPFEVTGLSVFIRILIKFFYVGGIYTGLLIITKKYKILLDLIKA